MTAPELVDHLRDVTPSRYQYLIDDLFETITLYDNRIESATVSPTDDGRYRVQLGYRSHKFRADGRGVETEIDHADWIEVGIFGPRREGVDPPLHLDKYRLRSGIGELEIIVDEPPARAGIDPRNLLIDRVAGNNLRRVSG